MIAIMNRLKRASARIPPDVVIEFSITSDCIEEGRLWSGQTTILNNEKPYGWQLRRRNITRTMVNAALRKVLTWEWVQALENPRFASIRVVQKSCVMSAYDLGESDDTQ